jgi:hypothetical protein
MLGGLVPSSKSLICRLAFATITIAATTACAHRARPSLALTSASSTEVDLAGTWEVVFHVTDRGDMRYPAQHPTTATAVGRMRLSPFHRPPPDPRYPLYNDWPRWIGIIHAPFGSLIQVPPFQGTPDHMITDSMRVGARIDSAGVRLDIVGSGCSDCGNITAVASLRQDGFGGRWSQEFFGTGDAGTWRMRRVRDTTTAVQP